MYIENDAWNGYFDPKGLTKSRDWKSEIEKRGGIGRGKLRLESGLLRRGKAVSELGGENEIEQRAGNTDMEIEQRKYVDSEK